MQSNVTIGIIGDFQPTNRTHLATNEAIAHAAATLKIEAASHWVPTPQIAREGASCLAGFDALWCSPGSPYDSMEGALIAIRFARESNRPFFAT